MHPNPFSLVYDTLWSMMIARTDFADLFKVGNRIAFNNPANSDPFKRGNAAADKPQVILVPVGLNANLMNTSSSSRCTRRYDWILSTDTVTVKQLHEIEWAIFCGMLTWQTTLSALLWPVAGGQPFCKGATIDEVRQGLNKNQNELPGIAGWSSVWSCSVDLWFQTSVLIAA